MACSVERSSVGPLRRAAKHTFDPGFHYVQHFGANVGILAARACWNVERMIGVRKELQSCARTELFDDRLQEAQLGEFVPVPLQEQHGNFDVEQMLRAFVRRPAGWMKRKSEKDQATNPWQWGFSLCLGRHPPTEGFTSCE